MRNVGSGDLAATGMGTLNGVSVMQQNLNQTAGHFERALQKISVWATKCRKLTTQHREDRCLQLRETLSLGEKRMLAVVDFYGKHVLVGATGNSITLLGHINSENQFSDVLTEANAEGERRTYSAEVRRTC